MQETIAAHLNFPQFVVITVALATASVVFAGICLERTMSTSFYSSLNGRSKGESLLWVVGGTYLCLFVLAFASALHQQLPWILSWN